LTPEDWLITRQRSEPWIAAMQSIAQEGRFVALQINLIRFFYSVCANCRR